MLNTKFLRALYFRAGSQGVYVRGVRSISCNLNGHNFLNYGPIFKFKKWLAAYELFSAEILVCSNQVEKIRKIMNS